MRIPTLLAGAAALVLHTLLGTAPAAAQDSIAIARSLPLTGPMQAVGELKRDGADAYIRKVNAAGGVGGRRIELVTLDDGYAPERTVANLRKIAAESRPVAMLGLLRLPAEGNTLPLLGELRLPAVGISSATDALRAEFSPWGFPVRSGFADEARKLAGHVKVIGIQKVALVWQDVPLGRQLKGFTEAALKEAGLQASSFGMDAAAEDVPGLARQGIAAKPQAIFLATLTPAAIAAIAELRKAGFSGAIYTYSSTNPNIVGKQLGPVAAGIATTQNVPVPNGPRMKLLAEYLQAVKELGRGAPSTLGLEAFIEAKVLVEGLRRAGANPTPASLARALESLGELDLGGFFVSYSPQAHTGSLFVEVSVLNARGELVR